MTPVKAIRVGSGVKNSWPHQNRAYQNSSGCNENSRSDDAADDDVAALDEAHRGLQLDLVLGLGLHLVNFLDRLVRALPLGRHLCSVRIGFSKNLQNFDRFLFPI